MDNDGERQRGDLAFRLERLKRLGNARLENLKRWDDRRPVIERYLDMTTVLHIHFDAEGVLACGSCRANPKSGEAEWRASKGVKMPMFVWVRDFADALRPVASIVRLQFLDRCDMGLAEALQVPRSKTLELLWGVHDEELRTALQGARVSSGECVDEVVECRSQIVDGLADEDTEYDRRLLDGLARDFARYVRLTLWGNQLALSFSEGIYPRPKLLNMLACPLRPSEGAIESMSHEVHSAYGEQAAHDARPRDPDPESQRLSPRSEESRRAQEITPPQPPEEVASEKKPSRRRGASTATHTRSGSPEDA